MTLYVLNKKEIDQFCWDHRNNGVRGVRGMVNGEQVNVAFTDMKTGATIKIEYAETQIRSD